MVNLWFQFNTPTIDLKRYEPQLCQVIGLASRDLADGFFQVRFEDGTEIPVESDELYLAGIGDLDSVKAWLRRS